MTSFDRHQLAAISIAGSLFDVLGSLYLAYDLLGGKNGPLRTLTRAVTYCVLFGAGFGLPLGFAFGIATGLTSGVTIALEVTRASKGKGRYPFSREILFSAIRGAGYAIGASYTHGWEFGAIFGVLSTVGQVAGYSSGLWPGMAYRLSHVPRITRREIGAAMLRAVGYGFAGYVSAGLAGHPMHAAMFGADVGLAVGIVTALANFISPVLEWLSDTLPDRRLGVFGIVLILIGFSMQSVQYWMALFDVQIR